MTQGKHFAAGGDHFAALPSKKIHAPKGIARLTVTAATMAAMTGSSLISPFAAFAQTGDGTTQHPAVMSPIAAHAGAASGIGAKSAAQTIGDCRRRSTRRRRRRTPPRHPTMRPPVPTTRRLPPATRPRHPTIRQSAPARQPTERQWTSTPVRS